MTRWSAAAASESPLFRISWEPRLSVITCELRRSTSCASCVEVTASDAAPVTVTCSVNDSIISGTSTLTGRSVTVTATVRSW